jgi:hypothetical protein
LQGGGYDFTQLLPTVLYLLFLQIRRGVLGFELEQLPPDMAEAAGLPQQQQQRNSQAAGADGADEHDFTWQLHSLRSSGLGDRQRYKEAADRLRNKLAAVRAHNHHSKVSTGSGCLERKQRV